MSKNRIIFSREHNAWWAPDSRGYKLTEQAAGRYSLEEAEAICKGAGSDNEFHYEAPESVEALRYACRVALDDLKDGGNEDGEAGEALRDAIGAELDAESP